MPGSFLLLFNFVNVVKMASFEKKGEQDAQPSTRTARDGDSTQESLTYRVARRVPGILRYVVAVALVSWVVWEYTRGWRDGEWVVGPAPSEWLVEPNNNIWNEVGLRVSLCYSITSHVGGRDASVNAENIRRSHLLGLS